MKAKLSTSHVADARHNAFLEKVFQADPPWAYRAWQKLLQAGANPDRLAQGLYWFARTSAQRAGSPARLPWHEQAVRDARRAIRGEGVPPGWGEAVEAAVTFAGFKRRTLNAQHLEVKLIVETLRRETGKPHYAEISTLLGAAARACDKSTPLADPEKLKVTAGRTRPTC